MSCFEENRPTVIITALVFFFTFLSLFGEKMEYIGSDFQRNVFCWFFSYCQHMSNVSHVDVNSSVTEKGNELLTLFDFNPF